MRKTSGESLNVGSRGVEASPVGVCRVGVRKHVVVINGPAQVQRGHCIDVARRCGVLEKVLISKVGVHVFNHVVHVSVVLLCFLELKVVTEKNKQMVVPEVFSSFVQNIKKLLCSLRSVIRWRRLVIDPFWIFGVVNFPTKAIGLTVVLLSCMS